MIWLQKGACDTSQNMKWCSCSGAITSISHSLVDCKDLREESDYKALFYDKKLHLSPYLLNSSTWDYILLHGTKYRERERERETMKKKEEQGEAPIRRIYSKCSFVVH